MTAAQRDILVVGGGVIGLAIALELRLRGATVTVLSRNFDQAAAHAAAGMLASHAEHLSPTLLDFCLQSQSRYPDWIRKIEATSGMPTGFWMCGILAPVMGEPGDRNLPNNIPPNPHPPKPPTPNPPPPTPQPQNSIHPSSFIPHPSLWLSQTAIHHAQPGLGSQVVGGWWYPEDGQVDNRLLARSLRSAAQTVGVQIEEGVEVTGIQQQASRVTSVWTNQGEWQAAHYVLATGAWSQSLLPVPVTPRKGQMLSVAPPPGYMAGNLLQRVLYGDGVYLVPRQDGRIVIGATNESVGFTPGNTPAGIHRLLDGAIRLFPALQDLPIQECWWGFRPATPDELPILGPSPYSNLTLAIGHYRNGILMAPATAHLLANLICDEQVDPLLQHFSWERFFLRGQEVKQTGVRSQGVKESEVKQPEVKQLGVKESGVKELEVKELEVKELGIKQPEVKQPEVKQPEVKQPEAKESGSQPSVIQMPSTQESETTLNHPTSNPQVFPSTPSPPPPPPTPFMLQSTEPRTSSTPNPLIPNPQSPILNSETQTPLIIAGRSFRSRLMTGTGKYRDFESMRQSVAVSGCEIVTVAVRRVQTNAPGHEGLAEALDWSKIWMLPNTAGCQTAEDAVRVARLGREMAKLLGQEDNHFVKLEVIPDAKYLLPDPIGTLQAAEQLVKEGFAVLPYINADPLLAKRLEEAGCATVMPLGSPIGSGQGIRNTANIQIIIENAKIPVVVDAGIGTPSEAAQAMEMGADALLINTAIAQATHPPLMAQAMALAAQAGRMAYLAGRIPVKDYAIASSPTTGTITS